MDHNWTDASGSRAVLSAVRRREDSPFVEIAALLVLENAQPGTVGVRIWSTRTIGGRIQMARAIFIHSLRVSRCGCLVASN